MICSTESSRKRLKHHASQARRELKYIRGQLLHSNGLVQGRVSLMMTKVCQQTIAQLDSFIVQLNEESNKHAD